MKNNQAITAKISIETVTVRLTNANNHPFWVKISESGMEFYDSVNSAGNLKGDPICKSGAEIFELIADEGKNKKFRDRKAFEKKVKKSHLENPFVKILGKGVNASEKRDD